MLVLDKMISWKKIVAYRWESENTLLVEYLNRDNKISDFKTYIPSEDELIIERLLGQKMKEDEKERKELLLDNEEN